MTQHIRSYEMSQRAFATALVMLGLVLVFFAASLLWFHGFPAPVQTWREGWFAFVGAGVGVIGSSFIWFLLFFDPRGN